MAESSRRQSACWARRSAVRAGRSFGCFSRGRPRLTAAPLALGAKPGAGSRPADPAPERASTSAGIEQKLARGASNALADRNSAGTGYEPERAAVRQQPRQASAGMPPWVYVAAGAGGVMTLALMIFVFRSLIVDTSLPAVHDRAAAELTAKPDAPPARLVADPTPARLAAEPTPAPAMRTAIEAPPPPRPVTSASGATLSTKEIVARCEPSVALMKGAVSSGTGFLIKRGIVATNAHVIEDEFISGLEVRFPSAPEGQQGPLPAQLLYEDRKRDIAFLAVASDLPVLELAPDYVFQKGEDILVIGNPGLGDDVVLENAISRGVMSAKTAIEGMNYYQMNIAINPGNSGGPVFDSSGRVIGVATLKSSKTEAMGFCIPVEEVKAATTELGRSHPEMMARHRAVATFQALTLAGAIYVVGIVANSGQLEMPAEDAQKLRETLNTLEQKLFSRVDTEVRGLQNDGGLSPRARRNYQELAAGYKSLKQIYGYPPGQVNQQMNYVNDLRQQHYKLVVSIRDELHAEVPEKLLTVLEGPKGGDQQQVVVVEMMPRQMQPGFRRRGPGMPGGRGPSGLNPGQATHNQLMRQIEQRRRQMQNQLRNAGQPGPP